MKLARADFPLGHSPLLVVSGYARERESFVESHPNPFPTPPALFSIYGVFETVAPLIE